jgi:GAF domain-containing protein
MMNLAERACLTSGLEEIAEQLLPGITKTLRSTSACLYVEGQGLPSPMFFQHGFASGTASELERLCTEQFEQIPGASARQRISVPSPPDCWPDGDLVLYPLRAEGRSVGLLGLVVSKETAPSEDHLLGRLLRVLSAAIGRAVERERNARQLSELNAYLTVSSMLAQTMDLHELLQLSLYCCMEVVSAQEASVLLLDDEKESLRFYHVEGPAKEALEGAIFPADEGLAGTVLRTRQPEVVNDPYGDPRFYDKIDSDSGFPTSNLLAFPLVAGDEPVGVMEVLNKAGGAPFTDEDRLLLMSIAEEIAFAIRNAKVFDYLVSTYCKQRQGQTSCKGCKRPLGSWTPCVRYRDTAI